MGHKIAGAIIEDGQLKYVDRRLPDGRLMVHLVYDDVEEMISDATAARIVKDASGIYKDVDVEMESRKLRESWERDVRH